MAAYALDPGWSPLVVKSFDGAVTFLDESTLQPGQAVVANNAEYLFGEVMTRHGFPSAFNANVPMTAMVNWLSSLGNSLVWFNPGTGIQRINVAGSPPVVATIVSTAAGNTSRFSPAGARLYATITDSDGYSITAGRVISFAGGSYVGDTLFPGPLTYTPGAPTEPGAGVVTQGTHRLAYAVEYRSGFTGRLSPDSGVGTPDLETFQPVSFTSAGSKNLSWTLNTTWPTGAVKVHVAMTPVSNPNLYIFVPGANAAVTGGSLQSVTITFSISDDDLLAVLGFNDATEHRLFLTQTTGGTAPFNPHAVFQYNGRMVYVTREDDNNGNKVGSAYISNSGSYQEITRQRHRIFLPGQLDIVTGFSMGGICYLLGPHWTYATVGSGEDPVNWSPPRLIDGSKGTLSVHGVDVSPTGNIAWVAAEEGLYLFDGASYPENPVSYPQSDQWQRINWGVAQRVQVLDDSPRKRVMVLAPLDGATTPSHILVWDYRERGKMRFSLWSLPEYSLGAMTLVQNDMAGAATNNQKDLELWVGPSTPFPILRLSSDADATPYRDNGAAIAFTYKLGAIPRQDRSAQLFQHHGLHLRAKGSGNLAITVEGLDGVTPSLSLAAIALATGPGKEYRRLFHTIGEARRVQFQTSALDARVRISEMAYYYSPYGSTR